MTLDMQSYAMSLDYRAEPEPRRRSAFGRYRPLNTVVRRGWMPILSGVSLIGQTLIGMAFFAASLLKFCYSKDYFYYKYMKYK